MHIVDMISLPKEKDIMKGKKETERSKTN